MSGQHTQTKQTTGSTYVSDTQNTTTEEAEYKQQCDEVDDDGDDETLAVAGQANRPNHKNPTGVKRIQKGKIKQTCDSQQSESEQHQTKDNNNGQVKKEQNKIACDKQRFKQTNNAIASQNATNKPLPLVGANLKTSIYDWDSPSSFTGTVKRRSRRPHSVGATTYNVERSLEHTNVQNNKATENSKLLVKAATTKSSFTDTAAQNTDSPINIYNNNAISASKVSAEENERSLKGRTIHREVTASQRYKQQQLSNNKIKPVNNMPKSQRQGKENSTKLRHSKSLAEADRNANNATITTTPPHSPNADYSSDLNALTVSQHSHASSPSTLPAACTSSAQTQRRHCNASYAQVANELCDGTNAIRDANYMELSFYNGRYTGAESAQFTELFRDFPVSYESTSVITNAQFAKCGASAQNSPKLPACREPPPPTPPPISQMPTRESRYHAMQTSTEGSVSISAPVTPSRGKVVLSKKERKELSKLNARLGVYDGSEHAGGSASAQSSPYKGRVSELKNCLARGLFASLSRSSQKSLVSQSGIAQTEEVTTSSNEISPPPPAPADVSPPNSNASNNNDADYTEKLKNLPVRQRKTHVSHMDNYCLFDPVDFINEKQLRQRTQEQLCSMFEPTPAHGLRDPLFSSQQNLNSEEEIVPEVIYNEDLPEEGDSTLVIEVTFEEAAALGANFDHHNYFVIDPDDFEKEPAADIGIPNPYTNEQLVHANLEALALQTACNADEPILRESASLEQLLEVLDTAPSMSNSQESKDTNTTASTTTTTSTALVESSTSTNSASSSTSATSSQTTLQRTKKKLTFLNLSPFRTHSTKNSSNAGSAANAHDKRGNNRQAANKENDNKTQNAAATSAASALHNEQRAISELVSSEHMLHLQHMLLDGKEHLRARTVPIESNYVLFNPGPVPSRNVPYKIRKPRPLSSHSDADSGFLSPCSPDELSALKFNSAILVLQQCDSVQGYIEVSNSE